MPMVDSDVVNLKRIVLFPALNSSLNVKVLFPVIVHTLTLKLFISWPVLKA